MNNNRTIEECKKLIQHNLNRRTYESLIIPLLDAIERENKATKHSQIKNIIDRFLNELNNKIQNNKDELEDGKAIIDLTSLDIIMMDLKHNILT